METKTTDYTRVKMLLRSRFFFVTIMWFNNLLFCSFRVIYVHTKIKEVHKP